MFQVIDRKKYLEKEKNPQTPLEEKSTGTNNFHQLFLNFARTLIAVVNILQNHKKLFPNKITNNSLNLHLIQTFESSI